MKQRTLDALRALAERPGTEAEGVLAREILARHEGRGAEPDEDIWKILEGHVRGEVSAHDFIAALRRYREHPVPTRRTCACGMRLPIGTTCANVFGHESIQLDIQKRFKKGDRVYYNRWAYPVNCPGVVTSYIRLKTTKRRLLINGDHPWAWINVKFDHLKSTRQVPIYSAKGWHLSHEPLPSNTQEQLKRLKELTR